MSQLSLSLDSSLLVRDDQGRYLMTTADQILEAARQIIDQKIRRGASFTSPSEVKDYLKAKLSGYEREVFAVMLMDTKHCLIEDVELFQGTIDQAAVYPREVVKLAMQHNAAAMIISHNHPSGNPEPSRADELLTKRLKEALALVDVRVLDHIIVAGNDATSFAERGLI
ncbi:DNA repair protein RadC [Achromobacter sp. B7]|uniref:RadC family protein n=1 Tax=Achromobacter sp. B7 TaxID=2282475 RepID=UPI000E7126E9|nr:DNA repair protein RadC [Achromobacter sp. B7]AYD64457.1 DNA repair protein RadC [Achromobacter sp. B7]